MSDRHPAYIWAENQIQLMKQQDFEKNSTDKSVYFKKRKVDGHPWFVSGELRIRNDKNKQET